MGWVITLLDTLMSEYGWTIEYTTGLRIGEPGGSGCSMAMALALYSAASLRYGNEPAGPTYRDREILAGIHNCGG